MGHELVAVVWVMSRWLWYGSYAGGCGMGHEQVA